MNNYFRITAYHPKHNVCAIFDSNGKFEKLWQFSSYLVFKGFTIVEVGADFQEGDLSKVPASESILLRACGKGEPQKLGDAVVVQGKSYIPKGA